jgi:sn-glycerol 3-phosphate transport system substrate-binding protein
MLMNEDGNRTFYDKPEVVEALSYWVDLSRKTRSIPRHRRMGDDAEGPSKKTAMMWTTTGNLTNVRNNAKFPFGVAMLLAGKRRGSPTGAAISTSPRRPRAPSRRRRSSSSAGSPRRSGAQWCVDTGYVAVRADAFETAALKKYAADFPPAAVARDQLQYAVAELSTHENQRVTKALNDGLQAALTGTKAPEQAMKDSQVEAERILVKYR